MYRSAMRCIFTGLFNADRIKIVNEFDIDSNKTSNLVLKLKELELSEALIIVDKIESNLHLASRNLLRVSAIDARSINPVILMGFKKLVMTVSAIRTIEGLLE
jgi:large subunit ribosomal protein L4